MKVAIIGNGNIAALWAEWLPQKGIEICQIVGRDKDRLQEFKQLKKINTHYTTNIADLTKNADLYIIAVPDNEIENIANNLHLEEKIIVHCAGSQSIQLLKNASNHIGVLWPIYSINKNALPKIEDNIPFIYDASDEYSINFLTAFIQKFTQKYSIAKDEPRKWMHLCAVISNNFTNYLGRMVQAIGAEQNIPIEYLNPIWEQTVSNYLSGKKMAQLQTGPAQRNDQSTIHAQINLLNKNLAWQDIYKSITTAIQKDKH